jgi:hypothetical protein
MGLLCNHRVQIFKQPGQAIDTIWLSLQNGATVDWWVPSGLSLLPVGAFWTGVLWACALNNNNNNAAAAAALSCGLHLH